MQPFQGSPTGPLSKKLSCFLPENQNTLPAETEEIRRVAEKPHGAIIAGAVERRMNIGPKAGAVKRRRGNANRHGGRGVHRSANDSHCRCRGWRRKRLARIAACARHQQHRNDRCLHHALLRMPRYRRTEFIPFALDPPVARIARRVPVIGAAASSA